MIVFRLLVSQQLWPPPPPTTPKTTAIITIDVARAELARARGAAPRRRFVERENSSGPPTKTRPAPAPVVNEARTKTNLHLIALLAARRSAVAVAVASGSPLARRPLSRAPTASRRRRQAGRSRGVQLRARRAANGGPKGQRREVRRGARCTEAADKSESPGPPQSTKQNETNNNDGTI